MLEISKKSVQSLEISISSQHESIHTFVRSPCELCFVELDARFLVKSIKFQENSLTRSTVF